MQLLTDSFTRPANTTAYASNQLVANSTTAASVVPLKFKPSLHGPQNLFIRRAHVKHSNPVSAPLTLRLYNADPSANSGIANGDGGSWSTKESSYLGQILVTTGDIFTDYAKGFGVPSTGSEIGVVVNGNTTIYGLLETTGAYTPTSGETFQISLEVYEA